MLARWFFSIPKTKNQRSALLVVIKVRLPARNLLYRRNQPQHELVTLIERWALTPRAFGVRYSLPEASAMACSSKGVKV